MDWDEKTEAALWRYAVIGPLISARLEHGDVQRLCKEAAEKTYELGDGRRRTLTARTIESWYYLYRKGKLDALRPKGRSDAGKSRAIRSELAERLLEVKKENMQRSVRMLIRTLERAGEAHKGELKRSTVHRLLQANGLSGISVLGSNSRERRAFRPERAGALWMGDVMHGPQVIEQGRLQKAYLHVFIDAATRFVTGAAFRLGETALDLQAVLKPALRAHGLPRVLYLDRGAAQKADSLRLICAILAIRLVLCKPRDPEAKAGVERFIRTLRGELLAELMQGPLTLAELNSRLWSWLSVEYHAREHGGTRRRPLEHWLEQAEQIRPAPRAEVLDAAFLHSVKRMVRKDGTVRWDGRMLEVRPELCGREVEIRYDPERKDVLPRVFVDGAFVCDTVELDLVRNCHRQRRPARPSTGPSAPTSGLDPLGLMQDEHARKTRTPRRQEER